MFLQLGGLGIVYDGITAALSSSSVNTGSRNGKFDFWYQWRNSESSATAWRILRKEGYNHYSS